MDNFLSHYCLLPRVCYKDETNTIHKALHSLHKVRLNSVPSWLQRTDPALRYLYLLPSCPFWCSLSLSVSPRSPFMHHFEGFCISLVFPVSTMVSIRHNYILRDKYNACHHGKHSSKCSLEGRCDCQRLKRWEPPFS